MCKANGLPAGNQVAGEASDAPEVETRDSDTPKAQDGQGVQGDGGPQDIWYHPIMKAESISFMLVKIGGPVPP